MPKDHQTLTLVLAGLLASISTSPLNKHYLGIRSPKPARNQGEKSEPFGTEVYDFSTRRYMQRDVEFEVESIDKSGGFIGTLYVNKTENVALTLLKEGLATVHEYSAEGIPWARQLREAEVYSFC